MQAPDHPGTPFEPHIAGFLCPHCGGGAVPWTAARHPPQLQQLTLRCANELSPEDIRAAVHAGADGVIVLGCLLADCLTGPGHVAALRAIYRHQMVLKEMGLRQERLRQEWVAPCEVARLEEVLDAFVAEIRALGPAAGDGSRELQGRA